MADPRHVKELRIFRSDIEAGKLKRTSRGCSFEFQSSFLANSRFDGLSYQMKKAVHPFNIEGNNLHPFFAGLLPEGLRLKSLLRNIKTSPDDLFSLFVASGNRVIGDVYADSMFDTDDWPIAPKLNQIDFYDYLAEILTRNTYLQGEDTISGVQEKISASMINFPVNIAKSRYCYILKLNPKDKPNLIENEFCCMRLAELCGIEVAKTKLVKDKNHNLGLLVERFDRKWDESRKKMLMHHQEDACQFLNRYPADKYIISMNDIAKGIERISSAPAAILIKLIRIFCFSYLLGNGDLHAKNISLVTFDGGSFVNLTPAYDLISTYIYGDHKMANKFDGKDDNIRRSAVINFGARFGILKKAMEHMLDKLISDFAKHNELLTNIPMEEKSHHHLQRMIEKRLADLGGLEK
ncbi:MAG: HipA domain-containing protein [Candidatus Riflebacteria bacterium]|nr:HipA domain-containing protein [Candidatus Riflebacteria bacterium]